MAETFQLHVHSLKHAGDFLRKVQRSVVLCITGSGIQPGNAFPQLFYFFITHTGWKSFMATVTLSHLTQKVLVLYNTKSFLIYVGLDDETCAGIHTIIKRFNRHDGANSPGEDMDTIWRLFCERCSGHVLLGGAPRTSGKDYISWLTLECPPTDQSPEELKELAGASSWTWTLQSRLW